MTIIHHGSGIVGREREGGEKHQDQTAQVTTSHENSPPLKIHAFFRHFCWKGAITVTQIYRRREQFDPGLLLGNSDTGIEIF